LTLQRPKPGNLRYSVRCERQVPGQDSWRLNAEELVDKLAARRAEAKSETFGDKLGDLEGEALVDTLANTLALAEGGKPCYTVSDLD